MVLEVKEEDGSPPGVADTANGSTRSPPPKGKARPQDKETSSAAKRRCVSTACIACRKRKSKCDGNTPSCAACSSVYGTECIYDPNSDHRRKGVYKKDIDNLKTRNDTLQTLIEGILNLPEDDVASLVNKIRTCDSLDDVAESILLGESGQMGNDDGLESPYVEAIPEADCPTFERELSGKMGELRLDNGSVRFYGGTSNLIYLESEQTRVESPGAFARDQYPQQEQAVTSWTTVTSDPQLILHLVNMYFTWHYTYFTTLSKNLFFRDFYLGDSNHSGRRASYCTPLLVNTILSLGCHFTSVPGARSDPDDPATAGDHFFKEAKRLILENDEHEKPNLTTVQALALMSVREAGCGREAKGWVYSGMSFRMACDIGLNLESVGLTSRRESNMDEEEIDARRITFWGCFLFDKCWSNYLGRQPQLQLSNITVAKIDVFPTEDADIWAPYTDSGTGQAHAQPARTRAVALQISLLCEISSDLLGFFYSPTHMDKHVGKSVELKKLSELHTRLEAWRKNLPREMEPKEGALPSVLVMQPFLKYNRTTSPLPAHVSPRKLCTQAASLISKLIRLYKRTYGLRQIVNVAVYIVHSACTIHLLNLPDKTAKRDIVHGVKHLEEIAESWLVARRTLGVLRALVKRWKIDLPEEAAAVFERTEAKYGSSFDDASSQRTSSASPPALANIALPLHQNQGPNTPPTVSRESTSTSSIATPDYLRPNDPLILQQNSSMSFPTQFPPHPAPPSYTSPPHMTNSPYTSSPPQQQQSQKKTQTSSPTQFYTTPNATNGFAPDDRDWWMKDQSALIAGFGNWNGLESDAPLLPDSMGTNTFSLDANAFNSFGTADWYAG
ncbi:MAG: hypothetical protein M1833_003388 [Piccolia ochrophora]|nr:MAG: hypothetical protein M1833_003388 [Piccolia ochrophora]